MDIACFLLHVEPVLTHVDKNHLCVYAMKVEGRLSGKRKGTREG